MSKEKALKFFDRVPTDLLRQIVIISANEMNINLSSEYKKLTDAQFRTLVKENFKELYKNKKVNNMLKKFSPTDKDKFQSALQTIRVYIKMRSRKKKKSGGHSFFTMFLVRLILAAARVGDAALALTPAALRPAAAAVGGFVGRRAIDAAVALGPPATSILWLGAVGAGVVAIDAIIIKISDWCSERRGRDLEEFERRLAAEAAGRLAAEAAGQRRSDARVAAACVNRRRLRLPGRSARFRYEGDNFYDAIGVASDEPAAVLRYRYARLLSGLPWRGPADGEEEQDPVALSPADRAGIRRAANDAGADPERWAREHPRPSDWLFDDGDVFYDATDGSAASGGGGGQGGGRKRTRRLRRRRKRRTRRRRRHRRRKKQTRRRQ